MRFVRCEQCGAKALIAASQCPRCTNPLALRDSRGVAVPLAHCPACDTFYPRSRGGCGWCGTTSRTFSIAPFLRVAGLVAAIGVVGTGLWLYRSPSTGQGAMSVEGAAPRRATPGKPSSPEGRPDGVAADTVLAPESAGMAARARVSEGTLPDGTLPDTAVPVAIAPHSTVRAPAASPSAAAARPQSAAPQSRDRYAGPWTRATARSWVHVRETAMPEAKIVGVVTPNTRVRVGEWRSGWRRVRAAGVEGWADASYFVADSSPR